MARRALADCSWNAHGTAHACGRRALAPRWCEHRAYVTRDAAACGGLSDCIGGACERRNATRLCALASPLAPYRYARRHRGEVTMRVGAWHGRRHRTRCMMHRTLHLSAVQPDGDRSDAKPGERHADCAHGPPLWHWRLRIRRAGRPGLLQDRFRPWHKSTGWKSLGGLDGRPLAAAPPRDVVYSRHAARSLAGRYVSHAWAAHASVATRVPRTASARQHCRWAAPPPPRRGVA